MVRDDGDQAQAGRRGPTLYDRAAAPVLSFAEALNREHAGDTLNLVRRAATLLEAFGAELGRLGAISTTVTPARLALGLVIDQAARANRRIDMAVWAASAPRFLFDGREMSVAMLQDLIRRADAGGAEFAAIKAFLEGCNVRLVQARTELDRDTGMNWTGIVAVLIVAFALAVFGWVAQVEWRYHQRLSDVFAREATAIGLAGPDDAADLAERLDQLQAAAKRVEAEAARVPVHLAARMFGFDAGQRAMADYGTAVGRHLPQAIAQAIDEALATEGGAVPLYDTVRAWSALSGAMDWQPAYLRGWLADRGAEGRPDLAGLARHVMAMGPPGGRLPPPDPELLDQATEFAAEAPEADRAFLELRRADAVAAIPGWVPDRAVPGLDEVVFRRSGVGMDVPVPGLFTAAGWAYSRDVGAGVAVTTARTAATRLFGKALPPQNDAPDRVMAQLQAATLAIWSSYLADLRVKPFQDADAAVRISGVLALADSPLNRLLRAVWDEAGGNDRQRDHAQQLQIAAEFGPMIQYVEQGRMREISALFAGLNVALGAMDRNAESGLQRLMTVQDRAQSVTALRQAPAVVVQIVEDVLAQTGAAHADMLTNPLTRAWQAEALGACRAAVEGRYPFAVDGADADPAAVTRLLGPGGVIERFVRTRAADYLDMATSPWRWKPEARFAGLSPDSAAFLERAAGLGPGLSGLSGPGAEMTLAALAQKGEAVIAIGGTGGAVTTTVDSLRLSWPGPDPAKGAEVSFTTPEGAARLAGEGPWGLLRLLEPFRLRDRDAGKRFVIDLRAATARLFLEVTFASGENPLAERKALRGLACPPVL